MKIIKIFKSLALLLKKIDIFGRKTELKIKGCSKYKTKLGGFFTILMIVLCLTLLIYCGSDMFYRTNPTVIFSEIFNKNPKKTYFSKENYFFMFGIETPLNFTHFIDESIYNFTVVHQKMSKVANNSFRTNVEIERCTEYHLPNNTIMHDYFMTASGAPINQLYCVKDIDKYYIEGSFDAENYVFFEIFVNPFENNTDPSSVVCKTSEEINNKLSGFFAFYTTDYLIDPNDFNHPGKPVGKDYFSPISV